MIGKIVQGADFRGVVNYVMQKPDAEPLGSRGLRNDSIDHIVESFRTQATLNPIAKPVVHISLNFSAYNKERLTNKMMLQIAYEYLNLMGYGNTQVLIVRHHDREHPHLHHVINRIDNDGRRISDKNERVRNAKICRELSEKYVIDKIQDNEFVQSITRNATNKLIHRYKEMYPENIDVIKVLNQVNIMTPENIHVNSFMYEPILDMSNHHLKTLYTNVIALQ